MKVYIIAGEASGDLLAAGLMRALLRTGRDVEFRGVGGPEMEAYCADGVGVSGVTSSDSLSGGSCVAVDAGVSEVSRSSDRLGEGGCVTAGVGSSSVSNSSDSLGRSGEYVGVERFSRAPKFRSLFDISEISVMGFFEVLPRLPLILRRIRQTIKDIEDFRPDVLVTVDSWGFVAELIARLRRRERRSVKRWRSATSTGSVVDGFAESTRLPVVHYVAPQVWAWKKGRARSVARLVDRLMTLLPDEGQYFEKHGLQCDFVGHPIVERVAEVAVDHAVARGSLGIPPQARVVSVLPGSRSSETRRLKPIFDEAVDILRQRYDDLFVIESTLSKSLSDRLNAFSVSDVAIAKSGTVSLELAAVGTPHLIAYSFNRLTNFLVKLVIKIRFANLINLLADREIIPEFVLDRCRADLIAEGASRLLDSPADAAKQVADAQEVMKQLRLPDILPSDRAAEIVIEVAGVI